MTTHCASIRYLILPNIHTDDDFIMARERKPQQTLGSRNLAEPLEKNHTRLLTVNLKVFVLPVLDGDHVQSRPVGEHQASGFLKSKKAKHTQTDSQVRVKVYISILSTWRATLGRGRAEGRALQPGRM